MPKTLNNEIMSILREFNEAGAESSRRAISQTKEWRPRPLTRIVSFIFERTKYHAIYDDYSEDKIELVQSLLENDFPRIKGELVRNPHDQDQHTYGLRFKGKELYLYKVQPDKGRLDHELSDRYPDLSRSLIQKYIKAGYVTVNEEVITKPNSDVTSTDAIALNIPEKTDHSSQELPIIYIDDDIIVVNKPAGILTHSKGALNDEFTVADFFRRYTTNALDTNRPGIVHRLDRDTSGIIIGARHDDAALDLKQQFADRTVKKTYTAVVQGVPKQPAAVIDLPIGRNPSLPSQFRVDSSGKSATTMYEVIESDDNCSLVRLKPKTGRTHQLRVHMAYIGNPILGDRVYGSGKFDRLYLHATALALRIGMKEHSFEAPVPKSFDKVLHGEGR